MFSDEFEGSGIGQKESMVGDIDGSRSRGRGRNRGVVEVEEKEE